MNDENDIPFGGLATRERARLTGARIEAVVAEVRIAAGTQEIDAAAAARLAHMFAPFGAIELEAAMQQDFTVVLGPGGAPATEVAVRQGWQFTSPDRACVFTVLPAVVSLQMTRYDRWSTSMQPQLEALLTAATQLAPGAMVQRAGLRYINRLPVAEAWTSVIDPVVAGVLAHPALGALVQTAHQQVEFLLEPGVGAILRHGPLSDNDLPSGYLVDIDVFDAVAAPLTPLDVVNRIRRLNRTAFSLFTQVLTADQYERMGPQPLDEVTR